jgi:uncharacterized protein (TIGR02300 family)
VAKPELGGKRQCQNCGTKFFDLNHDPIVCPKCGTVFQALTARSAAARRAEADDEEAEADPANVELVSLEDAEATEAKATGAPEDEIEIEDDDDAAADETFLEEEEEDSDDVAGLIDGDIEDDEES